MGRPKKSKTKKRKTRPKTSSTARAGENREDSSEEFVFPRPDLNSDFSMSDQQLKWRKIIETPEKRAQPPPTPSTASPQRVFRSPFLDAAKIMNVFTSPAKPQMGNLRTPSKLLDPSHSPLRAGFSPFSSFVVNLSPLNHGAHPQQENMSNSVSEPTNPFEQSPLGGGLQLLSNLGSAVKDGAVILKESSDEEEEEQQRNSSKRGRKRKKKKKGKKGKNKKTFWKRLDLGRDRNPTTPKRGLAAAAASSGRYSSPVRPELKFGSGRISLTTPSPKFLRSPSSFTIKLGGTGTNSPVVLTQNMRSVNNMLRTPMSQRRRILSKSPEAGGNSSNNDKTKLLIPVSNRKACNCKKSKCLKLYCECFAARMYCVNCNCVDCHNNSQHDKVRNQAIKAVLDRNPKAFDAKIQGKAGAKSKKHSKGCHCKKSGCKKKYCECFQAGIACAAKCKCVNCENTVADRKAAGLSLGNVGVEDSVTKKRGSYGVDLSIPATARSPGAVSFVSEVDSLGGFDNLIDDDDHDITDSPLPGRLPILRGSQNSNSKESSKETSSSLWPPMIVPVMDFNEDGLPSSTASKSKTKKARKVDGLFAFFGSSNPRCSHNIMKIINSNLTVRDMYGLSQVSRIMSRATSGTLREYQIRREWDGVSCERIRAINPTLLSSGAAVAAIRAEVAGTNTMIYEKMTNFLDQPHLTTSFMGPLNAGLQSPPTTPKRKVRLLGESTPVIPAVSPSVNV